MKEEYLLYLDESEHRNTKNFVISGFAIKKCNLAQLETEINQIKKLIWDDAYIERNSPVLHCTDLQLVYEKRFDKKRLQELLPPYHVFAEKSPDAIEKIYTQVYARFSKLVRTQNVTIFSCVINVGQLNKLFVLDSKHDGLHMIEDKYNIALQKIIENYTHYLAFVDGYGDVIYESRNTYGENSSNSPDIKMINGFHQIHANNKGIVYINNRIVKERTRVFSTASKYDNMAGLQLADFIAYNILKFYAIKDQTQITDFMKQLHRFSYNGGLLLEEKDQRSFWGYRVMPSYPQVSQLEESNKKLVISNHNLKRERSKLNRKIKQLEEIIAALSERLDLSEAAVTEEEA